jgi:predicted O-methyltransferase YrrM
MKTVLIKDKLAQIGVALEDVILGDFDLLAEHTAKRHRSPNDVNYKKVGCYYRSNYERGILIYNLIRKFNLTSMLEIGFGRGYSTFCACKAFADFGVVGQVVTIDPYLNEDYVKMLQNVFPKEFFNMISFVKASSQNALKEINEKFDLVYIDGDHSYQATKLDWEGSKDKFNKFLLFDDYHLPSKDDSGTIACREAIDEIDYQAESCDEPELIIMDRRIFIDDRGLTDDQINYGQVLLTKSSKNEELINHEW